MDDLGGTPIYGNHHTFPWSACWYANSLAQVCILRVFALRNDAGNGLLSTAECGRCWLVALSSQQVEYISIPETMGFLATLDLSIWNQLLVSQACFDSFLQATIKRYSASHNSLKKEAETSVVCCSKPHAVPTTARTTASCWFCWILSSSSRIRRHILPHLTCIHLHSSTDEIAWLPSGASLTPESGQYGYHQQYNGFVEKSCTPLSLYIYIYIL